MARPRRIVWPPGPRIFISSIPCAASSTSTRSARAAAPPSSSTTCRSIARWQAFGWHVVVIDGHEMIEIVSAYRGSASDQGPSDRDPGAHAQGQGRVVYRGETGLARQGVFEGTDAAGSRRAAGAVLTETGPKPRDPAAACAEGGAEGQSDARAAIQDGRAGGDAQKPARPSRNSAPPIRAWSRSTPTSRTPPSVKVRNRASDRFFQFFIAEQVMIGAAMAWRRGARFRFPDVRRLPHPRGRLHPWPPSAAQR